jgi:hypothetical protein
MEKTAVEWLINEITLKKLGDNKLFLNPMVLGNIVKQALEMEKQQIIDAYISGYSAPENLGYSEQYYNQTYK